MDKKSLPRLRSVIKPLALAAALAPTTAHANVVFDFIETDLSCVLGTCPPPTPPFQIVIAELVLPGPNSAGSAEWLTGLPILPGDPPPTWQGDPFIFTIGNARLSSSNLMGQNLLRYSLSWREIDNVLTGITLDIETPRLTAKIIGNTGMISAEGFLGSCFNTQCQVRGEWDQGADNFPQLIVDTAEPGAIGLTALTLAGICGFVRRRWADLG